ncbi:MAG: PAS domain S-box protein [Anaerolineales bacterium]|nr:MAG: PAS domain S-box protein [Anaerolineales bacterium]
MLYNILFDNVPLGLYRSAPDGKLLDANPAIVHMLGYPNRESFLAINTADTYVNLQDRQRWKASLESQGVVRDFEVQLRRHDGTTIWVRNNARVIRDDEGQVVCYEGTMEDITQRVQAEAQRDSVLEALRESEERYRSLFDHVPVGLYRSTPEGQFLDANMALVQMFGYPDRDSLLKTNIVDLYVDGQQRRQWQDVVEREGIARRWEVQVRRRDGTVIWIADNAQAIRGQDGRVLHYEGTLEDITERVTAEAERDATLGALQESNRRLEEALAELKVTQTQALQQERLAAVGQLAAGIAHDFNNLLTSIIGFAELLQIQVDLPQAARADLARIVKQGQRGAHLVRQILDFSRKSISQPQSMNLASFVKESARLLERTIPENIRILVDVDLAELPVRADPTQLQQMLTNLAINARDAMPAGGQIRIGLSHLRLKPGEDPPYPDLPPGEWGVLTVSDTGAGIAPEILPHIFEPFFTTKGIGQGTGLGLAQAYGIVKQHDGHIDVISQIDRGTEFTIYLPLYVSRRVAQEEPAQIPRGRGQTILLVEDEPTVLLVGQTMLERLGYRVLTAVNGQQALKLYSADQDEIALVLTDMVMPGIDGMTLLRALKAQNPSVRGVMITGYPMRGEGVEEFPAQGIVGWLQKPLTLTELAQVVSRALPSTSGKGYSRQEPE